jgi:hypothetical protein
MLRAEVLPGKKVRGRFVDALQAQKIAQGNVAQASDRTKEDYNKNVISVISRLFEGGAFGTQSCEEAQRQNPLRKLNLFAVESLNGYTKMSELLAAVTAVGTSAKGQHALIAFSPTTRQITH